MRILVCGATGFIGSNLVRGLSERGHQCLRGVRRPEGENDVAVDYRQLQQARAWLPLLQGVDAVIAAVGVLRDSPQQPIQELHAGAPGALFRACAEAGVGRIVNISALGVDSGLDTPYFNTKAQAEQVLFALPDSVRWLNLRPSVVYGREGDSAKMFRLLASLPLHALPMGGRQRMQPVHVDDLVAAVGNWLEREDASRLTLTVAGSEVVTMRQMLDSYRRQMGKGEALHIPVPGPFIRLAAKVGNLFPSLPLCDDTLTMLEAGNTGDNSELRALLGREPLSIHGFLERDRRNARES